MFGTDGTVTVCGASLSLVKSTMNLCEESLNNSAVNPTPTCYGLAPFTASTTNIAFVLVEKFHHR